MPILRGFSAILQGFQRPLVSLSTAFRNYGDVLAGLTPPVVRHVPVQALSPGPSEDPAE